MSLDPIRRIISGKKARYTNDEENLDLDLVQLTDRVTLMGYPATGTAALYRNKRSEVIRYLQLLPSPPLIVNLCPRYESAYPSSALCPPADRVVRFPFPDHYPPPLSLLPVAVAVISKWMNEYEDRTLIIHCKAGKGRSGTMALSYLLSVPGLPSAPSLEPITPSTDPTNQPIDPSPRSGTNTDPSSSHLEKLERLLEFHTSRRMAPGTTSRGVSIASQRRWLSYWARMLDGDDPRPKTVDPAGLRKVRIDSIRIHGEGPKGLWGKLGGERMAVQVFHYRPSIASELRARELALHSDSSNAESKGYYDDDLWDDEKEDMIQRVGGFSEPEEDDTRSPASSDDGRADGDTETPIASTPSTTAPSSPHPDSPPAPSEKEVKTRTLYPSSVYIPAPTSFEDVSPRSKEEAKSSQALGGGLVMNADEGIQFKFLLGKSGRKHSNFPAMAALGIMWFIPSFEQAPSGKLSGAQNVFKVEAGSIDFLKSSSGIESVEIGFTYLP